MLNLLFHQEKEPLAQSPVEHPNKATRAIPIDCRDAPSPKPCASVSARIHAPDQVKEKQVQQGRACEGSGLLFPKHEDFVVRPQVASEEVQQFLALLEAPLECLPGQVRVG